MAGGATAAECVVREGDEFSTLVRLGQVETLKESGSKSIGVRVFFGQRAASTYSSDFSRAGLDRMVKSALELAKITSEDPFGGIPAADQLGQLSGDLDLYHEDVYSLPGSDRIDYARRAEKAALDFDPRIKNTEGGSFDAATGHKVLANSHGFVGEYRRSYCSVAAVPIAQDSKRRDAARLLVLGGAHAGEARCARKSRQDCRANARCAAWARARLRPRKCRSCSIPWSQPRSSSTFLKVSTATPSIAARRFSPESSARKSPATTSTSSTTAPSPAVSAPAPFDGEGIPTRRTVVIENGVLKSYLLNTYTAKKLGLQTTGNASRGLAGTPGIGPGNYFLQPGTKTPQEIIGEIKEGLYVTEFLGHGANLVTGDYSRGASGMWISGGEFAYPVEEITVAGNLKEMFFNISEIANDLEFRGSVAAPTIRIDGLTVGGE